MAQTTIAYGATGTVASRTDRYADGTTGQTTFGYDWAHRLISVTAPAAYATGP